VVLLAVGAGFGGRAISLGSRAASECPERLCSPSGLQAVSDGRSAANVANGTLVAGAALAVAGAVLIGLSYGKEDAPARSRSLGTARFVAGLLSGGGTF
jgi:hypothetical protein